MKYGPSDEQKQRRQRKPVGKFKQKPSAELPYRIVPKEVHGQLVDVKVYETPDDAAILEGVYEKRGKTKPWRLDFHGEPRGR